MFTFHANAVKNEDINDMLQKFWEIESVEPESKTLNTNDQKVIDIMNEGMVYDNENQRYTVPVPWKDNKQ